MEDTKELHYGDCYTARELAEALGVSKDFMLRILCRAEFFKWIVPKSWPRRYKWNIIFQRTMDRFLELFKNPDDKRKKGRRLKCID